MWWRLLASDSFADMVTLLPENTSNTVSRFRMLLILLALDHGTHVGMDSVEFIDCTAYRLEPQSQGSYNDLDGEVIEAGPVQGMVLPGATQAYCYL